MLIVSKLRDKRRKEIESEVAIIKQETNAIRQIATELNNKYLPVRDKCIELIRGHNLGRYSLAEVFGYHYEDGKLRIVIYDPKEEYWDGKCTLKHDDKLLDETIPMNIPEAYGKFVTLYASFAISKLKDPNPYLVKAINNKTIYLRTLEDKLDNLNKK